MQPARRSRALGCGCAVALLVVVGGWGGGNDLGHRADLVVETLHEKLAYAEVDGPPATHDEVVLEAVDTAHPQAPDMRIVIWKSWTGANRLLTGRATSTVRHVGFCREVGTAQPRRVCVVADRVTAESRPRRPRLVVKLAVALFWAGVPGEAGSGIWKPPAANPMH